MRNVASLRNLLVPEGIARDSTLTLGSNLAGGFLAILFLAIWSRALSLEEFGTVSLALAVGNLLRPLLDLGINNALIQGMAYSTARKDARRRLRSTSWRRRHGWS